MTRTWPTLVAFVVTAGAGALLNATAAPRAEEARAATAVTSPRAVALILRTITHEGRERQYYEYAPSNVEALREYDARGVEVLVSLHDVGQTAAQNALQTGWPELGEEKGFVAVFPVALDGSWNTKRDPLRANDLSFVVAVAADVRTRYGFPSTMSTFLSGAGAGATMAQELAMRELGVMATGVAAFGGAAEPDTLAATNLPKTAMAVWQFEVAARFAPIRLSQQVAYWQRANGANARRAETFAGGRTTTYYVQDNPVQQVRVTQLATAVESPQLSRMIWEEMFGKVVRFPDNKSYNGTLHPEQSIADMGLIETIKELRPGVPRRWLTYVPPNYAQLVAAGKKLPLLFSFHGRNGSARFQAQISQWHDVARDEGFIVVYPHGLGATWTTSIAADNVDVEFFLDLLAEMKTRYALDDGRVFLNGSSQGTALTNRIAVQYPQLFAAIAPCYSGHLSAASYTNAIVRTDIALPVWQCRGEQELPSEFPGGTAGETAARTFWRETVNRNFGPPTLQLDGRRRTEIWNDGRAEYRWQVTSDIGHAWHPGQARKMWTEMLSKYRRGADGSLLPVQ